MVGADGSSVDVARDREQGIEKLRATREEMASRSTCEDASNRIGRQFPTRARSSLARRGPWSRRVGRGRLSGRSAGMAGVLTCGPTALRR